MTLSFSRKPARLDSLEAPERPLAPLFIQASTAQLRPCSMDHIPQEPFTPLISTVLWPTSTLLKRSGSCCG